jgi:hypothetical protein
VDDGLQELGARVGDAPGEEEIVEDQQIRLDPPLSNAACSWGLARP